VKMAKEQGLALNPVKISGQCGRLLCCLSYEFEAYCDLRKGMPKCGKKVCWNNQEWEVSGQNVLGRQITLRQPDGGTRLVSMAEYESGQASADTQPITREAPRPPEGRPQRNRPARPPVKASSPPPPPPAPPAPPVAPAAASAEGGEQARTAGKRRRRRRRGNRPGGAGEQGE
jgi:hypothetical protein